MAAVLALERVPSKIYIRLCQKKIPELLKL